jgi:hypothetical protein
LAAAGASALPDWMNALIRVLAVAGATSVVGIGIWAVKMVRIPKRLADQGARAETANLNNLRALHDIGLGEQVNRPGNPGGYLV